eukprot:gene8757-9486_t
MEDWDVSKVTDMSHIFEGCKWDLQYLNKWNVSNVTNMRGMFQYSEFVPNGIEDWDVSKVTDTGRMFRKCKRNSNNLSKWNVSNVRKMDNMFCECRYFNQDLNKWDVSKVTDMNNMFWGCVGSNPNVSDWNVSNVTDMSYMFYGCNYFEQDLNKWNVSNVCYSYEMFEGCYNFLRNESNDTFIGESNTKKYKIECDKYTMIIRDVNNESIDREFIKHVYDKMKNINKLYLMVPGIYFGYSQLNKSFMSNIDKTTRKYDYIRIDNWAFTGFLGNKQKYLESIFGIEYFKKYFT